MSETSANPSDPAATGGATESPAGTEPLYEVRDLAYTYPHTSRTIFSHANLTVQPGEVVTVLGPNGAGKSTFLNCLGNLRKPDSGTIRLCGQDMATMPMREVARRVAYVQQNHTPVFAFKVVDFVTMGRAAHVGRSGRPKEADRELAREALRRMGIEHLAEKPYTDISGGERQQAVIARAICQAPKVLLLDEPTSHLDFGNQLRVLDMVQQVSAMGFAVIMTTHDPNHAILLGGTVAVLDRGGTLTCGTTDEVMTEEFLKGLYRTDLTVAYVEEIEREAVLGNKLKPGRKQQQ